MKLWAVAFAADLKLLVDGGGIYSMREAYLILKRAQAVKTYDMVRMCVVRCKTSYLSSIPGHVDRVDRPC
jgi:hypothetical protein